MTNKTSELNIYRTINATPNFYKLIFFKYTYVNIIKKT